MGVKPTEFKDPLDAWVKEQKSNTSYKFCLNN